MRNKVLLVMIALFVFYTVSLQVEQPEYHRIYTENIYKKQVFVQKTDSHDNQENKQTILQERAKEKKTKTILFYIEVDEVRDVLPVEYKYVVIKRRHKTSFARRCIGDDEYIKTNICSDFC